jgi:hypothetical protein
VDHRRVRLHPLRHPVAADKEAFGWSTSHALLVSTLVSVGTAIVVLGVGPVVDRLGRRKG